jgi:adenylate cyclase
LGEARQIEDQSSFVSAFAARLTAAGVPLCRATTGIPTLHPQLNSTSVLWQPGEATVVRRYRLQSAGISAFENSPLKVVYEGGGPVRCRIAPQPEPGEFGVIPDLRAEGVTDYLVLPMVFSDGDSKAMTFATKAAGGFDDDHIALLQRLVPLAASILEILTLREMTRTLLDTYVGPIAGQRVLEGQIKRGDGQTIRAVVWFADLRDFSTLSDRLPRDDMIELLNDYFGALCAAVDEGGGEVLKFIGDALLAIFPWPEGVDGSEVAARALGAVGSARSAIDAVNEARVSAGAEAIRFAVALHVGEVLYGNIGGEARLDFTVIGPAVNLASRIEALAAERGEPVLLSADFAALLPTPSESLGSFRLKGLADQQAVFRPTP